MLGGEKARERGDGRVVHPLPDAAGVVAAAGEEPRDLVLVHDRREQLAGRGVAAGELRAGGQELEKLHDDRVEDVLADLAHAGDGAGEAGEVGLGEPAQEARGLLGADRGQHDRRLLDRARHQLAAERHRPRALRLRPGGDERALGLAHARVAPHHRAGEQAPAVGDHEEGELEGQRDDGGRHHHHAHRHQDGGDHEVDDEKGQEDQEADLEAAFDLGEQERGHEDSERRAGGLGARLGARGGLGHHVEGLRVDARLHEDAERGHHRGERLLGRELARDHRLDAGGPCLGEDRLHHEVGEKEREAHDHHVRRRLLHPDRLAEDREHRHHEREAGDHDREAGREREQGDQEEELDGAQAERGAVAEADRDLLRQRRSGMPDQPDGQRRKDSQAWESEQTLGKTGFYARR